jgi:hypothetical protein
MKYKFIDIGCGSFDVSSDYYGNDVVGIYVEPIKEYLDVLPGGKTIIRVNAAISEKNGFSEMTTFPFNEPIRYMSKKHISRLQKSNKTSLFYAKWYYYPKDCQQSPRKIPC